MNFIKKPKTNQLGREKSHIPGRLNFLFVIVFLLFAALIGQLAYLQIMHGPMFEAEVSSGSTEIQTENVQRGQIYDSSGKILVSNKSSRAITYTKPATVTAKEMYHVAEELSKYINVDTDSLTSSNKADYYLATHEKDVLKQILNASKLKDSELYKVELEYVKKHKLYGNLDNKEKQVALLYAKMNGAYALSTVYLKTSDVSDEEMAKVGENLNEMPGVKIGTYWKRDYPNGKSVESVIGSVTTEKSGLPSDSINKLLAQGYSRDDSVGSSYIEAEYENILKGTKKIVDVETQNGKVKKRTVQYSGQKGNNVILTINEKFQQEIQKELSGAFNGIAGSNPYAPGAYVVVMDPNTGAIYALAGISRNLKTGKITEDALGTINQSYVMGSVAKGATVMGGLTSGVITPNNNVLVDTPIRLRATAPKTSWFNKNGEGTRALTAQDALAISSNSYMMQLVMKEANYHYVPGDALSMSPTIFDKMRNNFNQFGLGVKTGVDIPGESYGYAGASGASNIGKALDLSFGNYDSYTTIQLAQYVSALANGGYRLQPHILKEVRQSNQDGSLGKTLYQFEPNVLNVYDATKSQWNVVNEGFYDVIHGRFNNQLGTGPLADLKPAVAGKTGTAQTFYGNTPTITHSMVTYAPSGNPKVAIAVAFPGMGAQSSGGIVTDLVKKIYEQFFKDVLTSDDLKSSENNSKTINISR